MKVTKKKKKRFKVQKKQECCIGFSVNKNGFKEGESHDPCGLDPEASV